MSIACTISLPEGLPSSELATCAATSAVVYHALKSNLSSIPPLNIGRKLVMTLNVVDVGMPDDVKAAVEIIRHLPDMTRVQRTEVEGEIHEIISMSHAVDARLLNRMVWGVISPLVRRAPELEKRVYELLCEVKEAAATTTSPPARVAVANKTGAKRKTRCLKRT